MDTKQESCCGTFRLKPMMLSSAAHTDLMDNFEQVFDEPVV